MNTKRPPRRPTVTTGLLRRLTDERAEDIRSTIKLYKRIRKAHAASIWSQSSTFDRLTDAIYERLDPQPPEAFRNKFRDAIAHLLVLETAVFFFPHDTDPDRVISLKEQVDLRRFLRAKEHFLAHDAEAIEVLAHVLVGAISTISDCLPKLENGTTVTVPLAALMKDVAAAVSRVIADVFDERPSRFGLCVDLNNTLTVNICRASGIEPGVESRKPYIFPNDADLPPDRLVSTYLGGTPFEPLFQLPVPFAIPRHFYPEHTLVIAASGSGKTQYLQNVGLNFLNEPDPPGMFILDSQDDEKGILHKIANLALFDGRLKDRLVILSPEDKPALNLFSFSGDGPEVDELFTYLMSAIDRDLTAKMSTASAYILRLLRKLDRPTIHAFKAILENPKQHETYIEQLDQTSQDFFKNQFSVKSEMGATRLQVASRLYSILANRAFTDMFAADQNCFDAFEAMQQKKIVLVNTSERKLGAAGLKIFGRYIVAQVMAAAMKRGETSGSRDLTLLMLDEAHEYFDAQTEKILRQARKFNVGLIAATQMYDQIEPKVKAALATNTTTKVIGRVSHADARDLANEVQCDLEAIRNIDTGQFIAYVRGFTPKPVVLNVPFGVLEAAPRMTVTAHQALRERNRAALASATVASTAPTSETSASASQPAPNHPPSPDTHQPDLSDTEKPSAAPLVRPGKTW